MKHSTWIKEKEPMPLLNAMQILVEYGQLITLNRLSTDRIIELNEHLKKVNEILNEVNIYFKQHDNTE